MKITKIATSVIALGAIWLGGTAYISSNTQSSLEAYVEKSNALYQQNGMHLSVNSFKKGFLESEAEVSIDFTDPLIKKQLSDFLKLPLEMKYKIENGPLLLKDGVALGASRIKSTVNISDYLVDTVGIKKYVKEDIILTSTSTISFLKNNKFHGETNPIVADIEGDVFRISPLKIEGDVNIETFVGDIKVLIESIEAKVNKKSKGTLNVSGISLDGTIKKLFENGFYLGDFDFKLNDINFKGDDVAFELKHAQALMNLAIDENQDKSINMHLAVDGTVGDSKLPKELAFLKKIHFAYLFENMELKGLLKFQDFSKALQEKQQAVFLKLSSAKTMEEQMKAMEELQALQVEMQNDMLKLFVGLIHEDKTTFGMEASVNDVQDKESEIKAKVGYVGKEPLSTDLKVLQAKFKKELLSLITLDLNLNLHESLLESLPPAMQADIQQKLQMLSISGMLKHENKTYTFDANYVPKKLMVNGVDKSDMLILLEMGLQQAQ